MRASIITWRTGTSIWAISLRAARSRGGADPYHVAVLAHVQAARVEYDLQRLIPRHVLQPQGQAAADRVAGNDVEVGEIGDHVEHAAHFDVLKVLRQLLAAPAALAARRP